MLSPLVPDGYWFGGCIFLDHESLFISVAGAENIFYGDCLTILLRVSDLEEQLPWHPLLVGRFYAHLLYPVNQSLPLLVGQLHRVCPFLNEAR